MATLLALVCPMALSSILLYHCNIKLLQVIFNIFAFTEEIQSKQVHFFETTAGNVAFVLALQSPAGPFTNLGAGEHE